MIEMRTVVSYFPPWRIACLLCNAGLRDEALVYLVARSPFSSPLDSDIVAISERQVECCILALDENVLWCRIALPQAQRIVRLLRSGQLAVRVHAFEPASPQVLSGACARLLAADAATLAALPTARRQPPEGFRNPHRVRASLVSGPQADVAAIRRRLETLSIPAWKLAVVL